MEILSEEKVLEEIERLKQSPYVKLGRLVVRCMELIKISWQEKSNIITIRLFWKRDTMMLNR